MQQDFSLAFQCAIQTAESAARQYKIQFEGSIQTSKRGASLFPIKPILHLIALRTDGTLKLVDRLLLSYMYTVYNDATGTLPLHRCDLHGRIKCFHRVNTVSLGEEEESERQKGTEAAKDGRQLPRFDYRLQAMAAREAGAGEGGRRELKFRYGKAASSASAPSSLPLAPSSKLSA